MARHLVMAGNLLEDDPELAYLHAQAAVRRAGRVDVVREAAGLTAYRTGRYAEALRELRTVRRLNGSDEHLALMADCERGLGRPERAIALAQDDAARALPDDAQVELAIVVAGARLDLDDPEAALAALSTAVVRAATGEAALRAGVVRVAALEAAGREDEAAALRATLPADVELSDDDVEVVVYDLEEPDDEQEADEAQPGDVAPAQAEPGDSGPADEGAGTDGSPSTDDDSDPEENA